MAAVRARPLDWTEAGRGVGVVVVVVVVVVHCSDAPQARKEHQQAL